MNDNRPVFVQIMEKIESDIITGIYNEDDIIMSTTQISKLYNVNLTTAVKAIGKLTDAGVLYKKRGIGMCVAKGAREKITAKRREVFFNSTINAFLTEANTLGLSFEELTVLLKERQERNEEK